MWVFILILHLLSVVQSEKEIKQKKNVLIRWFQESGCTGFEVEALSFLSPFKESGEFPCANANCFVQAVGFNRVDTCPGDLSQNMEILTSLPQAYEQKSFKLDLVIHVSHIAYEGVCGQPKKFRQLIDGANTMFVSRSMFESTKIPHLADRVCNKYFDYIWVPTDFNLETFSGDGVSEKKLRKLPELIPPLYLKNDDFSQTLKHDYFSKESDEDYIFFSDFKWEDRKNWKTLTRIFVKLFVEYPHIKLIIKAFPYLKRRPEIDMKIFLRHIGGERFWGKQIFIIDNRVSGVRMLSFYQQADCFILISKAEGWGLPLIQAMSVGLPAIAINFSGHTEYMTKENSYLINYSLEPHPMVGQWAKIDTRHLVQTIKEILRDPEAAKERGLRGQKDVRENYSSEKATERLVKLVDEIIDIRFKDYEEDKDEL